MHFFKKKEGNSFMVFLRKFVVDTPVIRGDESPSTEYSSDESNE
jgi:hypothetical protein